MIAYLETSAAIKLLKPEAGSDALGRHLNTLVDKEDVVVSSTLLETELRRAAVRQRLAQSSVTALLDRVGIFDLTRSMFTAAGILPGAHLRSLDALHIVAARRANADVMISYDQRQIDAAEAAGLRVHFPK
jgi:predicted nucleic acid-binding protein